MARRLLSSLGRCATAPCIARCPSRIRSQQRVSLSGKAFSPQERANAVSELCEQGPFSWQEVEGRDAITKSFDFHDFSQAWSFMSRGALVAGAELQRLVDSREEFEATRDSLVHARARLGELEARLDALEAAQNND